MDPITEMFDALLGEGWTAEPVRPKAGDVVRVDGPYWGAEIGATAVIDSAHLDLAAGTYLAVFAYSAHRPPDGSFVSCSGGPCPFVQVKDLTYVGTTEQTFWRWKDGHARAHNGVNYVATVNLWSWTPPERER